MRVTLAFLVSSAAVQNVEPNTGWTVSTSIDIRVGKRETNAIIWQAIRTEGVLLSVVLDELHSAELHYLNFPVFREK